MFNLLNCHLDIFAKKEKMYYLLELSAYIFHYMKCIS